MYVLPVVQEARAKEAGGGSDVEGVRWKEVEGVRGGGATMDQYSPFNEAS